MLRLNLSQRPAKINIETQRALLNLTTTMPKLEIHSEAATVEITGGQGQLSIDQTPCRASYGMLNNEAFARDGAERGRSTAFETIGRLAEEGDRMMRIESHENAIANMAADKNSPEAPEVVWQGIAAPDIEYRPTPVRFHPIPAKLEMNFIPGQIENDSTRGAVQVSMAQYNKLDLWVTGSRVDNKV